MCAIIATAQETCAAGCGERVIIFFYNVPAAWHQRMIDVGLEAADILVELKCYTNILASHIGSIKTKIAPEDSQMTDDESQSSRDSNRNASPSILEPSEFVSAHIVENRQSTDDERTQVSETQEEAEEELAEGGQRE